MNKKIYIFSGLGADERVFNNLDFSGHSITFIRWIKPIKNESIENYASRLLEQILDSQPILIGLSFGGIMAIEVAKQIETKSLIIIASAKTKNEIPFYYRLVGLFRFHKLIPTSILKKSNFIVNWFFDTTSTTDKKVLKEILSDTDSDYLSWAIDKIVHWKNKILPKTIFHIHGSSDKILPHYFVNCDLTIKNGGHLMTLNKSDEITQILRMKLND